LLNNKAKTYKEENEELRNLHAFPFNFKELQSGKVQLKLADKTQIKFSQRIAQLLGDFKPNEWYEEGNVYESDKSIDLNNDGISAFIIYCDLVHFSFLGKVRAPMIALVSPSAKPHSSTDVQIYRPNSVHYYDVNSNFFHAVKIYITDQNGNPVQFVGGVSIIKMHLIKTPDLETIRDDIGR